MTKSEKVRALAKRMAHNTTLPIPSVVACGEAATALRAYADLLEEREREERLLQDGLALQLCDPFPATGEWLYTWTGAELIQHPDRATAAKLAEEEMDGNP